MNHSKAILPGKDKNIADFVRSDYRTADVFKKYGINFCCGGQQTLAEACASRNLEYDTVAKELEEKTRTVTLSNSLKYDQWKLDFLVDYILNIHHAYLDEVIPALEQNLSSFIEGHKKKFPELIHIQEVFRQLSNTLGLHNRHEEEIIFPYIKQIEAAHRRDEPYARLFVRTLRKPLSNIEKEHENISSLLMELKAASKDYTYPVNACTSHQLLYHKLKEFHDDMIQHKYLEINILFPKAIAIEQLLLQV